MNDNETRLTSGLLKAITAEWEGNSFYRMAAETSKDPKAREVFGQLAQEELSHMEYLTEHYESVLKTGKLSGGATLGKRMNLSDSFPIFSEDIKSRLKEAHFEMSSLSIGIKLELDAMNFYKAEAQAVDDPEAKRFYTELSEWEAAHYHALLRQQEALKEDYWSAGGFAPF
ncbi:MAG: ferritin family protein [Phycisphaerales bacterium]|nr:MAG: ferritin family protein [Phycisphaerales bacterium]